MAAIITNGSGQYLGARFDHTDNLYLGDENVWFKRDRESQEANKRAEDKRVMDKIAQMESEIDSTYSQVFAENINGMIESTALRAMSAITSTKLGVATVPAPASGITLSDKPVVKEIMPYMREVQGREEVLKIINEQLKTPAEPQPVPMPQTPGWAQWAVPTTQAADWIITNGQNFSSLQNAFGSIGGQLRGS